MQAMRNPPQPGGPFTMLKIFAEINIEVLWWECIKISQSCFGHMTCLRNLETNSLDGSASLPARVFSILKMFGCLHFQMFNFSKSQIWKPLKSEFI